jgi:hypothetical protein
MSLFHPWFHHYGQKKKRDKVHFNHSATCANILVFLGIG